MNDRERRSAEVEAGALKRAGVDDDSIEFITGVRPRLGELPRQKGGANRRALVAQASFAGSDDATICDVLGIDEAAWELEYARIAKRFRAARRIMLRQKITEAAMAGNRGCLKLLEEIEGKEADGDWMEGFGSHL